MAKCEANHILAKYTYDPVTVFATSKIQPLPYQLEDFLALVEMLRMNGVRSLLAYETGLGKTIVAGLFIRELLSQKPGARVLVLVPPMAISQWLSELGTKFGLVFRIYETSEDLGSQLLIASMDTLRGERRFSDLQERESKWNLIVVDELHRATPGNKRYALIQWLRDRTEHMLGLTATPHDGKAEHFIGRLQLMNASIDSSNFRYFVKEHCFRRQKKEATDMEGRLLFPYPVDVNTEKVVVSEQEQRFYEAVESYVRHQYKLAEGSPGSPRGLLATVMGRMASSSIRTGMEALKRRRGRLLSGLAITRIDVLDLEKRLREAEEEEDEEAKELVYGEILESVPSDSRELVKEEIETIKGLIELGEGIKTDSKLNELKKTARLHVAKGDKVIVFTSFVTTAEYLAEKLKEEFGEEKVFLATGHVDPDTRKENINRFLGSGDILVGTEVIGESLNLQEANVVYNYELPWSPIPYIQRVGRVYRYPQKKPIFVHNFSSQLRVEERVLEIVYRKVNNLVRDFDEGSVAVIGTEVTERTIEDAIREAYQKGVEPAVTEISERLERAERNVSKIKEVLNISEAANRHVDVSGLIKDPSDVVTQSDVQRFLDYARYAGIGYGNPYGAVPFYYVEDTPVRKFSMEDRAVKLALEMATKLPNQGVALVWDKDDRMAEVKLIEYLDGNGRPFQREVVVVTKEEVLPYKAVASLRPIDMSIEGEASFSVDVVSSSYLRSRINYNGGKLEEQAIYKAKLLDDEEELIKRMELNPAFREAKLAELVRRRDELRQALTKVTVREIGALGFLRLCSESTAYKETKEDRYNPELLGRRQEVENAAMRFVMEYERRNGWDPEDVHDQNMGYDIISRRAESERYLEVKGVSDPSRDNVVLTHNEKKASEYFKDSYYLYVVLDPLKHAGEPVLKVMRPPFKVRDTIISVEYIIEIG